MSVTINIERETSLYGVSAREKWRATHDGESFDFELRMLPEKGSKALFVLSDMPIGGVPDEVLDEVDKELARASGVPA